MSEHTSPPSPILHRRRLLALGASAAAGTLAGNVPAPVSSPDQARRNAGHGPADADRVAGFLGATRRPRSRHGPQHHADHRLEPAPQRAVRAHRSSCVHRADRRLKPPSAICELAADQRRGAGGRPPGATVERQRCRAVQAVGRHRWPATCMASRRPPVRTTIAGSRTSSPIRSTSVSPARWATSTRASSSSTSPAPGTSAPSVWRSWIRTAPTCAISRAATISC